jgi:hypothetical protein
VPEPFNAMLSILMRAESWFAWNLKLPFGLTALVLARKNGGSDQSSVISDRRGEPEGGATEQSA